MFAHGHEVALAEGGVLNKATGQRNLWVNSVHYQGIARLGDGLRVEAAAPDGVIEAVSARVNGAPVLGVQWHPEWNTAADPNSVRSEEHTSELQSLMRLSSAVICLKKKQAYAYE